MGVRLDFTAASGRRTLKGVSLAVMIVMIFGGGCASRYTASAREITSLTQRVRELETARQRDTKRLEVLTTRLVALEAQSSPAVKRRSRQLPVVRMRPQQQAQTERPGRRGRTIFVEPEIGEENQEFDALVNDDQSESAEGERPLLKLHEAPVHNSLPSSFSAERETPRRRQSINLASVNERIPVVPIPELSGTPSLSTTPAALQVGDATAAAPTASTAEEIISNARQQVRSGECGSALRELSELLTRSPEHPLAPEAMLLRARCHRRQGAHLRAIGEVERMVRRYPRSSYGSQALLEMAEAYAALGDLERARHFFGQVMRRYPRSRAASRATVRVQELGRGGRAREER